MLCFPSDAEGTRPNVVRRNSWKLREQYLATSGGLPFAIRERRSRAGSARLAAQYQGFPFETQSRGAESKSSKKDFENDGKKNIFRASSID